MNDVAAVILAAGRGTRFNAGPKLLTMLHGKPLVRHVAQSAIASIAAPVIVVTGHSSSEVKDAVGDLDLHLVSNPAYPEGLSTSLKAGLSALPEDAKAAIVLLGDMPLIRPALIDELIHAWREMGKPSALIPALNGQRGNPVILSRSLVPVIMWLTGDTGAGTFLRGRSDVVEYPVDDPAILQDVDTTEDFWTLSGEA